MANAKKIAQLMTGKWSGTETEWRQPILRQCMVRGLLFVELQFDPMEELPFHPAINGTPKQVAEWLRQFADDIEGIT